MARERTAKAKGRTDGAIAGRSDQTRASSGLIIQSSAESVPARMASAAAPRSAADAPTAGAAPLLCPLPVVFVAALLPASAVGDVAMLLVRVVAKPEVAGVEAATDVAGGVETGADEDGATLAEEAGAVDAEAGGEPLAGAPPR
ncbi:hypothetical protein DENSPDRAFT_670942 [Dentipellis sp. KUC8613]|nr:hypothetical protein DENSPDRAFT_670942 [Dentipellis sp. KUC8613]